jgi:monovalent cation/hydrogen antiporter
VLYKFAVAATLTGSFSLVDASLEFVVISLGGVVMGFVLALLFVAVHRQLGDAFIEVLMTLATPYIVYVLAERMHVSGVLAVVTAGLVRGRYSPEIVSAKMRILARSMWNVLVFLLNSLIFILIGLQLSGIVSRLEGYSVAELLVYGTLVSMVAILVRFAWIYPASYVPRLFRRSPGPSQPEPEIFIMSWCGMRGIVSLAAALALPVTLDNGAPFPGRDLVIFLSFAVIAITLVLQGLTLAPLIRRLKVGEDWSVHDEHHHATNELANAAISAIDAMAARENVPEPLAERIRAEFAEQVTLGLRGDAVIPHGTDLARRLRLEAIRAERHALIRMWRENKIGDEVLHELEESLDYQEQRF